MSAQPLPPGHTRAASLLGGRRFRECAEAFGISGEYDPACCRFPKSCSPYPYREALDAGNVAEADLEPARPAPEPAPSAGQDTERLRDELADAARTWIYQRDHAQEPLTPGEFADWLLNEDTGPLRQLIAERDEARERLAMVNRQLDEHRNAADRLAAERDAARGQVQRVEALFAGGPDTPCRTTWRREAGWALPGSTVPLTECAEVPLDELRRALNDPEHTAGT